MKGLILCLVVIVTVDAVRSIPPTRTKKGKRPARFNDNPDFNLPSGADYPDSRRVKSTRPAAARAAPVKSIPPRAGAAAPVPARAGPPARAPVAAGRPAPAGRRNDNTDRGLPSGKDVPDGRRFAPAAPAAPVAPRRAPTPVRYGPPPSNRRPGLTQTRSGPPPARAQVRGRRPNDNPDFGLPSGRDYPDNRPYPYFVPQAAPPAPVAVAQPVFDCNSFCAYDGNKQVCGTNGQTYDNDCYRECDNVPRACENACPCYAPDPVPAAVGKCDYCYAEGRSEVCVDNEEVIFNECLAICEGKTVTCDGVCPCT